MKFKFCGDLDCPDWVLAEIVTLSKLSSVKVKLLCSQVLKELLSPGNLDQSKVMKQVGSENEGSGKAVVAALSFILSQAARYDAPADRLDDELQQLGLPKEHSSQIIKSYADNQESLASILSGRGVCISRVVGPIAWSVDKVVDSCGLNGGLAKPLVTLRMRVWHGVTERTEPLEMTLTHAQLGSLLAEVRRVGGLMRMMSPEMVTAEFQSK